MLGGKKTVKESTAKITKNIKWLPRLQPPPTTGQVAEVMTSSPACTWQDCFLPLGCGPHGCAPRSRLVPERWCEREGSWNQAESRAGPCGLRNSVSAVLLMKVEDAFLPVVVFEREPENKVNLAELFKGKNSVRFEVPGTFTSGCCETHLPGFV